MSVMAALNMNVFIAWSTTREIYTIIQFHNAFGEKVIPILNTWLLPNSIVTMVNPKIHMYRELEESIQQYGAILIFLPPYSPQLNPTEACFARLKK